MAKLQPAYQTTDGKTFTRRDAAEKHQIDIAHEALSNLLPYTLDSSRKGHMDLVEYLAANADKVRAALDLIPEADEIEED